MRSEKLPASDGARRVQALAQTRILGLVRVQRLGDVGFSNGRDVNKAALQRAKTSKVPRQRWHAWYRWQCGFCNLQNLQEYRETESLSLRQYPSFVFMKLCALKPQRATNPFVSFLGREFNVL